MENIKSGAQIQQLIIDEVKKTIENNNNNPMVKTIEIQKLPDEEATKYGKGNSIYKITISLLQDFQCINYIKYSEQKYSLKDKGVFHLFLNDEFDESYIMYRINNSIFELRNFLNSCQIKDYPLYRKVTMTQEEISANIDYYSDYLFHTPYEKLDKNQGNIVFRLFNNKKYQNGLEIIEDIKKFIKENDRFPFRTEELFKAYEYAKETKFLTDEEVDEIESLRMEKYSEYRHNLFNELAKFIEKNKRFPYETESEYKLWYKVCHYYKFNSYTIEEIAKLDYLYARYNNENDSLGERLVNAYLTGLGYRIEKQKTFPGLVYKKKLKFDTCIYIDDMPCLIEYDGPQHFQPIKYFGGEEGLTKTQIRDQIKNNYCEQNNIPLLRIKYTELAELEKIIDEFIDSIKKRHTK